MAQYVRQQGTNEVFMVDKDGAHYVDEKYALGNNVFSQVQVVPWRVDTKYQIATPMSQLEPTNAAYKTGEVEPPGDTTPFDYGAFGITDDQWNALTDSERAFFESTGKILQSQYDQGKTDASMNAELFNNAMNRAKTDPDILAKYGDELKLNQGSVERNLAMINEAYGQSMGLLNTQQEEERKALALTEAAAGRAQSGFREQAKQRLNQAQTGVIQSSRRELQNQLNQTGQTLEGRYGTSGLSQFANITAGGLSYTPMGGITGSIARDQNTDIYNQAVNSYNNQVV